MDSSKEIIARLAERPCLMCDGKRTILTVDSADPEVCWDCQDSKGQGTGLAFLWASVVCPNQAEHHRLLGDAEVCHPECYRCNGSGRVPNYDMTEAEALAGLTSWDRTRAASLWISRNNQLDDPPTANEVRLGILQAIADVLGVE